MEKTVRYTITVPESLRDQIKALGVKQQRNLSDQSVALIRAGLGAQGLTNLVENPFAGPMFSAADWRNYHKG